MKEYDHKKIEKKWQKEWESKKIYRTEDPSEKNKMYILDMFPYPSGAGLHVGHPRGYIGSDVYARKKRMEGFNVLHPMGFDAFGLPAEQYALEHHVHPRKAMEDNIKTYRNQLDKIGFSYDWSRQVNTTDPEYYTWTQWIFLKMYDRGLAYEGMSEVNWCPELGTVLANDEIVDGPDGPVSERGNYPVEKKKMRQWFLKITEYAERLLNGLDDLDWPEHIKEIQRNWIGKEEKDGVITYKMRDAVFARQRYWGEPIPLIREADGNIVPLADEDLPLELPKVTSYEPTGTGESPLAGVKSWMKKGYETNTMPGWAGSSWYFLRYTDPKNKKEFASKENLDYFMQGGVDMYIGGAEHATGHLLYARFFHKFLYDLGLVPTDEPFRIYRTQGLILASDGRKMSKRWGNVVNPDEIVAMFGADTLRVYEMFMGPFDASQPWNTESIIGSRRFIERVWRLAEKVSETGETSQDAEKILHKTIKKVAEDIDNLSFNTAISSMMICLNELEKSATLHIDDYKLFLQLLAPFAPHMTEELWHNLSAPQGKALPFPAGSIHLASWPAYDPVKIVETEAVIAVQVNGKVRTEIRVDVAMSEDEIKALARADTAIVPWIEGKTIVREIYVAGRLINIVVQ